MKKIIKSFLVLLFLFGFVAQVAAFTPKGEETVNTPAYAGSESASLTEEGIAKAVRKKMGNIPGALKSVKGEIAKKDTRTAKAIDGATTQLNAQIKNTGNQVTDSVKHTSLKIGASLAFIGFLVGVLVLLSARHTRRHQEDILQREFTSLSIKMGRIPTETAKEVKKLDPITIDFTIDGHRVKYTPPIVNGSYLSLYVPKQQTEEVADPSKIIRLPIDHRGKLYKSTLEVITAFLRDEYRDIADVYSCQQKELIRHLQAMKELIIEEV